jgi:excisionase family DNA binding protein
MQSFSIKEAAYLMGLREETLRRMIDNGKILVIKVGLEKGEEPRIHETEMSRFQHPWEHIFRLDQRVNSLQAMCEFLKTKINDTMGVNLRSDVYESNMDGIEVRKFCQRVETRLVALEQSMKQLSEIVPGMQESIFSLTNLKKEFKRGRVK